MHLNLPIVSRFLFLFSLQWKKCRTYSLICKVRQSTSVGNKIKHGFRYVSKFSNSKLANSGHADEIMSKFCRTNTPKFGVGTDVIRSRSSA